MLDTVAYFLWLASMTFPLTVLPQVVAGVLAGVLWKKFGKDASVAEIGWLVSPTMLSLATLLFAAIFRGDWRNPVNEVHLFLFHLLVFSVVPLMGYALWRTRRMWFIAALLCLPQLWQVLVAWLIGYMAITDRWL